MVADVMGSGTPAIESITMRMLLDNNHAGTIIGKGGTAIKAVREATGCRVNILEAAQRGAERLVTVVGPPLSCNQAVELILDRIEEFHSEKPDPGAAPAAAPFSHVLKLCVSNNQVGALIGKGGSQVKEFREDSGANIRVEQAATPNDPRIVTIMGGKTEVVKAHLLVMLKLASLPPESEAPDQPSKFQRQQPPPPQGYGGKGGGAPQGYPPPYYAPPGGSQPGYPPPYGGPPPFGAQGQMPPQQQMPAIGGGAPQYYAPPPGYGAPPAQPHGVPARHPAGYGPPQATYPGGQPSPGQRAGIPLPAAPGYAFVGGGGPSPRPSGGGGGTGNGGVGGAIPSWPPAKPSGGPDGEMIQLVPQQLAGRLIGKGGSGIRELREASHAQIKILSECEAGTELRKVIVNGDPQAVQTALALINAKLLQGP